VPSIPPDVIIGGGRGEVKGGCGVMTLMVVIAITAVVVVVVVVPLLPTSSTPIEYLGETHTLHR